MAWGRNSLRPIAQRTDRRVALKVSLALALGWTLLADLGAFESLERITLKARYWLRPTPGFSAPITIIGIDEASLAALGPWPWDRHRMAKLVRRLKEGGAAVVGLDIAFYDRALDRREDEDLARALRAVPSVLATNLAFARIDATALDEVGPVPTLARAALALGCVQISRRPQAEPWELEPYQQIGSGSSKSLRPAFPVAVASAYLGDPIPFYAPGPLWRESPWIIDYRGPTGTVNRMSAGDVLAGDVPKLTGQIVLVGAVATGFPDTNFMVPDLRNGPMTGVEIIANAVDNLITGGFLNRPSLPAFGFLMLLLALIPGFFLLTNQAGTRRHAVAGGVVAAWLLAAIVAFRWGIWLDVVPVVGFLLTCYVGGLVGEGLYLVRARNQLLERYAADMAEEAQHQRELIEGQLHDGVQQLIVAMSREFVQLKKVLPYPERAETRLERLVGLGDQMLEEIMRLRKNLLPPALRRDGLTGALPYLATEMGDRLGIPIHLDIATWPYVPLELEVELYWLIQEALNNVAKHADARQVTVRLQGSARDATVEVEDDGKGFDPPDPSQPPGGTNQSGLHRMWLRMHGRGGEFTITSRPDQGARLRFRFPMTAAHRVAPH